MTEDSRTNGSTSTAAHGIGRPTPLRGIVAWAFYDWANSPFTTVIITFVFAAYFAQGIVGDEVHGQALWGYTISISAGIIALLSPVFGAIADVGGPRKPWLLFFTGVCIVGSSFLWFAEPDPAFIALAMVGVIIANIGFELGIVFNNAMLADIVRPTHLGRWSGWAWGLGYLGGLAALVVVLVGFVMPETPLFGLSKDGAQELRVVGPLVAVWFLVFTWPLFVFTPDRRSTGLAAGEMVKAGMASLWGTFVNLRRHRNVAKFLIARMIYNDGLITVFALGGIYAAGQFGMTMVEVLTFGIALNVTAGLGAFGFAWLDDWLGSKKTVLLSLIGLTVTATGAVITEDVTWFWIWGSALGIFVGPAQAASRSYMAHLCPAELRTQFFGLYALSGKATAFVGPAMVALVTQTMQSQRLGFAIVVVFFVVGFLLLLTVDEPGGGRRRDMSEVRQR